MEATYYKRLFKFESIKMEDALKFNCSVAQYTFQMLSSQRHPSLVTTILDKIKKKISNVLSSQEVVLKVTL